jgi:two-component system response regulator (stage 0 sporulation protein A)
MEKLELETIKILRELKIPAHVMGYTYIKKAVELVHQDHSLIYGITTQLYPAIADEFGIDDSNAERGIRHAFGMANEEAKIKLFGTPKIKNGEAIATLVEEIRIRLSDGGKD